MKLLAIDKLYSEALALSDNGFSRLKSRLGVVNTC